MAEEVSAWEDYDRTAQLARPFPKRSSTLRPRRSSSTMRLSEVDSLLQYSKYFDSDAIEEGQEIASVELPPHLKASVLEIFAVFFKGSREDESMIAQPHAAKLMTGTMPWVPNAIRTSVPFEGFCQLILFAELCLRGIGQVYFQNSPLAGLLILIGLFIQSPRIALHGVFGLAVGNGTAYFLGFAEPLIEAGLFGYNAVLVGLALATFAGDWSIAVAIAVMAMSALSAVMFTMLGKILVPYQSPPLTFPFNLVTLMVLVSSASSHRWSVEVVTPQLPDYSDMETPSLSAGDFWLGTIRGIGQVFLADSVISGILILLGIAVCSPIAAVASYLGSLLGCLWAWGAGSTAGISSGLFGYNPSLCAAAMIMFYVPSAGSSLLAVLAALSAVVAQQATIAIFSPFGLPAMTIPFCIVALPFIIIQGTTSKIISVPLVSLTIPEDHMRRVKTLQGGFQFLKDALSSNNKIMSQRSNSGNLKSLQNAIDASQDDIIDNPDIRSKALDIFAWFNNDIQHDQFVGCLMGAGLDEQASLRFAGHVFKLMDLDNSGTIDREEFVALALASQALLDIHRDLCKFFNLVDADQSGAISFEELDAAGLYLGQTALSINQKDRLDQLEAAKTEDGEFDVMELVNFVVVEHVKALVSAHHDKTLSVVSDVKEQPSTRRSAADELEV